MARGFDFTENIPGAAKTFINRPASDIGSGDAPVGGSGVGGMGSMFNQVFSPT